MSEFSEALKKARVLIESREQRFICLALYEAGCHGFESRIMRQLSNCLAYETWLDKYHKDVYVTMTREDRREGRLQWIDHMIKMEEENEKG